MTRAEGWPLLNFGINEKLYQAAALCTSCRFWQYYQGSDNGISNLNQYELVLACLRLGSYSLEAATTQKTATAVLKREKCGKGAIFQLSAVLVMQHNENLAETKRDRELTVAAASFSHPIQPFEAMQSCGLLKKPLFLKVKDNQTKDVKTRQQTKFPGTSRAEIGITQAIIWVEKEGSPPGDL